MRAALPVDANATSRNACRLIERCQLQVPRRLLAPGLPIAEPGHLASQHAPPVLVERVANAQGIGTS